MADRNFLYLRGEALMPMNRRRLSAFTLVEVLIAIAVLSIMMLMLLTMAASSSKVWIAESKKVEVMEIGRAVLNQMARDLTGASLGGRPGLGSFYSVSYLQFAQNPPLPGAVPLTPGTDWLFWQAPLVRSSGSGGSQDPVAVVGYFLTNNTQGTGPERSLNRYYAECPAPVTGVTIPTTGSSTYNLYANKPDLNVYFLNAGGAKPGSISKTSFDPWDTTGKTAASILSENVLGLWIRCRDINGNVVGAGSVGNVAVTPYVNVRNSASPALPVLKYDSSWAPVANRLPASVEVTIVCIDSRSMAKLTPALVPALTDPGDPADLAQAGTDNYQTAIATFVQQLRGINVIKGAEIRAFTNIIPLQNGTYANPK